jgi:hypothetical protein
MGEHGSPPDAPTIQIPKPRIEEVPEVSAVNAISYIEALREQSGFSSGKRSELQQRQDWKQKYYFKWGLFVFILLINVYWMHHVITIVWYSGLRRYGFHLDNSVLITLVSTSVGNYVALVAIVARSLFPGEKKPS